MARRYTETYLIHVTTNVTDNTNKAEERQKRFQPWAEINRTNKRLE